MKTSDLKKIIKSLVKESLQEILLEEYIQKTVQKAINESTQVVPKSVKSFSQNLTENLSYVPEIEAPRKPQENDKEMAEMEQKRREMLRKSLGGSSIMTEIFEDTMKSNKNMNASPISQPVAQVEEGDAGVSEETLAALGAFRNWDKHIK